MMQLWRRFTNVLLLGVMAIAAATAGATAARAASENPLAAQPLDLLSDTPRSPAVLAKPAPPAATAATCRRTRRARPLPSLRRMSSCWAS